MYFTIEPSAITTALTLTKGKPFDVILSGEGNEFYLVESKWTADSSHPTLTYPDMFTLGNFNYTPENRVDVDYQKMSPDRTETYGTWTVTFHYLGKNREI